MPLETFYLGGRFWVYSPYSRAVYGPYVSVDDATRKSHTLAWVNTWNRNDGLWFW